MFTDISIIKDECSKSYSVMTRMKICDYLGLVNNIDKLDNQRDVLKTTTAVTIRKRLIDDIANGAVIPPIVLGFVYNTLGNTIDSDTFSDVLNESMNSLTIIDGIQRTESITKAVQNNPDIRNREIRVEFWISNNAGSLIYRMLVLNTGQVPWNTRRQVEVVYKPLIQEASRLISEINLLNISDNERRSNPGEFIASAIPELYLAFYSRKAIFDNKEKLADDFTRLDVINTSSTLMNKTYFFDVLRMLVLLDIELWRVDDGRYADYQYKIRRGRDLFTSVPSRVGFVVSMAQYIIGRPGLKERDIVDQEKRIEKLKAGYDIFISKLHRMSTEEFYEFWNLPLLNETLNSLSKKRIGDEERKFYVDAYKVLIEEKFDIENMAEAWRA